RVFRVMHPLRKLSVPSLIIITNSPARPYPGPGCRPGPGGQPMRLLDEPFAAGRHGQARSPDLEGRRPFHRVSFTPVGHSPALPGAQRTAGYRAVNVGRAQNPGSAGRSGGAYSCVARIHLTQYLMGPKRATSRA